MFKKLKNFIFGRKSKKTEKVKSHDAVVNRNYPKPSSSEKKLRSPVFNRENENSTKKVEDKSLRIEERKYREQIFDLWNEGNSFNEYLLESTKFREIYGKNVKCDICGWECGMDADLINYNGQTYCRNHLPYIPSDEYERKIMAGKHGASNNFIKK